MTAPAQAIEWEPALRDDSTEVESGGYRAEVKEDLLQPGGDIWSRAFHSDLVGLVLFPDEPECVWGEPIVVRRIDDLQARELILELLDRNPGLDQMEISERLRIRLRTVFRLLNELVKEGKISRQPYNE